MSLFIRAEQFGGKPILWSLSDIYITIGLDAFGALSHQDVLTPWFSVIAFGDGYFVQSHTTDVISDKKPLATHAILGVALGTQISVQDYTFSLVPTDASHSAVASTPAPLDSLRELKRDDFYPAATLSIHIANAFRHFPLFDGVDLSIGSSSADTLRLEYSGIAAEHVRVLQDKESTIVRPRGGKIITFDKQDDVGGIESEQDFIVHRETRIQLTPSTVEIVVKPQKY